MTGYVRVARHVLDDIRYLCDAVAEAARPDATAGERQHDIERADRLAASLRELRWMEC